MKTAQFYIGLVIITGIFNGSVLGEVQSLPQEDMPILIGQPQPALKGIRRLYIVVLAPGAEPNSQGLVPAELEKAVTEKIEEAGITIAESDIDKLEPNSPGARMAKIMKRKPGYANVSGLKFRDGRIPELRIDVDSLDIKDSNQVVFHVRTSLARLVHFGNENRLSVKTDVWQSEPIMRVVFAEGMPAAVTSAVLEQVEAFIYAYHAANPQYKRLSSDVNDVNEDSKERTESTPAPQQGEPVEYKYVASKNGMVFHKSNCSSAKRIKPENLVYYGSRDEAINAGKRPCKQCNP
jgi:hypothetical protein